MILEGLVATINPNGTPHVAPMGPTVDATMSTLILRPFPTSTTCGNLRQRGQGVLHVTDDVELLAQAAVGRIDPPPRWIEATAVEGWILADACRWYAFRVTEQDDSSQRVRFVCRVVDQGSLRDFFGFNRAKHAVVEAAILASRVQILPPAEIHRQFAQLATLVEKTGGDQEQRAFALLQRYVREHPSANSAPAVVSGPGPAREWDEGCNRS